MSYTRFGEEIKKIRIKHHEVMGDMAKVLNVSVPFLSSVENGKKNVPDAWLDVISTHYSLTKEEKLNLQNAIEESKTQIKINLMNSSPSKRQMAIQFQRSFSDLDEETINKISELLTEDK